MQLFGHRESGHTYKVRLMLALAGVRHDFVEVDIFRAHEERSEPFRSLSKFGEVPLLLHDGQAYVQSNAILCHLARHLKIFGGESEARMDRAREWLFWEANRIGFSLPHVRYAARFAPEDYPPGALDWIGRRLRADLARLDTEFASGRRFILDDEPSIADFALCGYLFLAEQAEIKAPPHVHAWLDRIAALPGYLSPFHPV